MKLVDEIREGCTLNKTDHAVAVVQLCGQRLFRQNSIDMASKNGEDTDELKRKAFTVNSLWCG